MNDSITRGSCEHQPICGRAQGDALWPDGWGSYSGPKPLLKGTGSGGPLLSREAVRGLLFVLEGGITSPRGVAQVRVVRALHGPSAPGKNVGGHQSPRECLPTGVICAHTCSLPPPPPPHMHSPHTAVGGSGGSTAPWSPSGKPCAPPGGLPATIMRLNPFLQRGLALPARGPVSEAGRFPVASPSEAGPWARTARTGAASVGLAAVPSPA